MTPIRLAVIYALFMVLDTTLLYLQSEKGFGWWGLMVSLVCFSICLGMNLRELNGT